MQTVTSSNCDADRHPPVLVRDAGHVTKPFEGCVLLVLLSKEASGQPLTFHFRNQVLIQEKIRSLMEMD